MRSEMAILVLMMPLACTRSQPEDQESSRLPPNSVVLKVPAMKSVHGCVLRVRRALEGLPWVDHESATANVAQEQVFFQVKDGMKLDEPELLEAFRKVGFSNTTIVRRPK
jgi:hypothetical protein